MRTIPMRFRWLLVMSVVVVLVEVVVFVLRPQEYLQSFDNQKYLRAPEDSKNNIEASKRDQSFVLPSHSPFNIRVYKAQPVGEKNTSSAGNNTARAESLRNNLETPTGTQDVPVDVRDRPNGDIKNAAQSSLDTSINTLNNRSKTATYVKFQKTVREHILGYFEKFFETRHEKEVNSSSLIRSTNAAGIGLPSPVTGHTMANRITAEVLNKPKKRTKRIITLIYPLGRLANKIFSFASFIGVSLARGMHPQLFGVACDALSQVFVPVVECNNSLANTPHETFREGKAAIYDKRIELLSNDNSMLPLALQGYFQSWKYFDKYYTEIKRHFIFQDQHIGPARLFIQQQLVELAGEGPAVNGSDVTFVGVHVRRGDMTSAYSHKRGYSEAPKQFIEYAMLHMRELVKAKHMVFIVTSDDVPWCKQNIKINGTKVVFSEASANVDLAILSLCNHSIITSGTFGWWGAYLAGGKTIYWKKFPLPGSLIATFTNPADYYYPSWIGIA